MRETLLRTSYALAEPRALLEYGGLAVSLPLLRSQSERGDGHPVLVFPPWLGDDSITRPLRRLLGSQGYRCEGWGLGRNLGVNPRLQAEVVSRVETVCDRAGRRVSLVGWSAGGIAAREAARLLPGHVRSVITLASPFGQDVRETVFGRVFRRLSGPEFERVVNDESVARLRTAPPVPSTAIYTASDGVVPPRSCRERPGPLTENIEVPGSHCGLGHNPVALFAILDRLAQPECAWRRFEASGVWRRFFRVDAGSAPA